MEIVTIVGTESGVLVLATESGERFALPIDAVLHRELRRATRDADAPTPRLAASPRDIQAQIRGGLSADEVAALLGVSVEDVTRFEGPVLAEREHIVGQALAVPVLIGSEVEPDAQPTFGAAVRAKLADADAVDERWSSWKDETGWVVKLEFTANEIDHDARWSFDPRRSALAPLNADAAQLSRQGSLPEGLIPRLRAVETDALIGADAQGAESTESGPRLSAVAEALPSSEIDAVTAADADRDESERSGSAHEAAARYAPNEHPTSAETADLLEALRRRRGQREPSPAIDETDEPTEDEGDSGIIALFDGLIEDDEPAPAPQPTREDPASEPSSKRRRRNAMPSWDEIVFGARTDE